MANWLCSICTHPSIQDFTYGARFIQTVSLHYAVFGDGPSGRCCRSTQNHFHTADVNGNTQAPRGTVCMFNFDDAQMVKTEDGDIDIRVHACSADHQWCTGGDLWLILKSDQQPA